MIASSSPPAVGLRAEAGAAELVAEVERGPLPRQDAYRLIRAAGSELVALMLAASTLRDQHKGRLVTYSRKVFVPLTNLCRDKCGYCTFAKPAGPTPMRRR